MRRDSGIAQGIRELSQVQPIHNFPVRVIFCFEPICLQHPLRQEMQGNNDFGYALQHLAPGPTRAEFPNPLAHRAPVRDTDNLRCLARRYLDHPGSQVDMVRIESGDAGQFKVVITLEMPGIL
jgi:hypothetical protein